MKRNSNFGMTVLFFFVLAGFVLAADPDYREGYLLVRFNETGVTAAANAARQTIVNAAVPGATIKKMYTLVPGLGVIQLPSGTCVTTAKSAMQSASGIQYTEPDYTWRVQAVPNDPSFGQLWGMNNTGQTGGTPDADIDAPEAWNLATGSRNIIVAVIDTGVDYTHPDLTANMWTNTAELNGTPGVDDDGNGYIDDIYGYDFANNDGDPMDDHSHGTHCSGTIGGVGNNGVGVAGVNWNVKIMALKFLAASGGGSTTDAVSCVQYAIQMGAKLTSNSWGGGGYSQALYDAIAAAGAANQLFVAAAGNSASNNDVIPQYPSSYNLGNIIAVLATTDTDTMSSFSCWGATSVDIGAPGSNIYSTIPVSMGSYGTMSGTSMACPHVAGACALIFSAAPTLTAAEVKQVLMTTADKKPSLNGLSVTGGRLNVASAVLAAVTDALPPLPDPSEWLIEPHATGLTMIVMQAKKATDKAGVEYFFDCIENDTFDSVWQSGTLYQKSTFTAGTAYSFRVKARDKSENHNETEWSATITTTTAASVDNLSPAPDPALWKAAPRKIGGSGANVKVGMEAYALDESGVQYRFRETSGNPGGGFTSVWQDRSDYIASGLSAMDPGFTYSFQVQARDKSAAQTPTAWSAPAQVQLFPPAQIREVPFPYSMIQSAIDAANNGDTVIVHPGTYGNNPFEEDIDFKGKAITVRSENPENPAIVAATIIDPSTNGRGTSDRAFIFQSGEGRSSVLEGFTIQNAESWESQNPRLKATDGFGGAIACLNGSSPTIRRCIIINSVADGSGMDGTPGTPNGDPLLVIPGTNGANANPAGGGGIYCDSTSSPLIDYCTITGCSVIANGGRGGDGEDPLPDPPTPPTAGSVGGNGGAAAAFTFGGGIYCDVGSGAVISNCIISNNTVNRGVGGLGGVGEIPGLDDISSGVAYGGGVCHDAGNTVGISATQISGNSSDNWGGGLWCAAGCVATLTDCQFDNNTAQANNGGGLGFDAGSSATLLHCVVSGNTTNSDFSLGGGVWFNWGGTLTLDNTDVNGNSASFTDAAGGGIFAGNMANPPAIPPLATTVILQNNSTVSNNVSQFGGGLCLEETNLTVNQSVISGNSAFYGGGAYWYSSIADIHDCVIEDNNATGAFSCSGAGIYCLDSSSTIDNVVLAGNVANGFGGAVFMAGPPLAGGSQNITNCLFVENSAAYAGGGISCNSDAFPLVTNCTFVGNKGTESFSSGGGVSCYDAFIEIIDSILWDNLAVYGPQIGIGDPLEFNNPFSTVRLTYSDIQGGEDDVFIGDGWGPWLIPSQTNIDANPLFAATDVSVSKDNYYLSHVAAGQGANSPCIDMGSITATAAGLDAYTTRTDHVDDSGQVDMGYHYDAAGPVTQYQLTIEVIDDGFGTHGTIDAPWAPGTYLVNRGTVVRIEALPELNLADPNYSYQVAGWYGTDDDSTTDVNNTVTMLGDRTVKIQFKSIWPSLQIVVIGDGSVTPEPGINHIYPPGTEVILTANPDNPGHSVKWTGTDADWLYERTNTVTMQDNPEIVTVEFFQRKKIYFPGGDYDTLQDAVNAANDGDQVIINSGTYHGQKIYISNKAITIQSVDPGDPDTVAATILDYSGYGNRAILIEDCGRDTVINGLTIQNASNLYLPSLGGLSPGADGGRGTTIRGGAIYINDGASPTILNCQILDCRITGGAGGAGAAGGDEPSDPATPWVGQDGGDGGDGGDAMGAGIYCGDLSRPYIFNCKISNCSVIGGNGAPGGEGVTPAGEDALPSPNGGDGGRGGDGGGGFGAGIYVGHGGKPIIKDCSIRDCVVSGADGADGGRGGDAGHENYFAGIGGDGGDNGSAEGGGIFFADGVDAEVTGTTVENCAVASGDGGNGGDAGADRFYSAEPGFGGGLFPDYWTISGIGGGVYCGIGSNVTFDLGCAIKGNSATGGMTGRGGYPMAGSNWWPRFENLLSTYGAGVFCGPNSLTSFDNSEISANLSEMLLDPDTLEEAFSHTPYTSYGGGICWFNVDAADVNDCSVSENFAAIGGGLYSSDGISTAVKDSDITDNTAYKGGGIYIINISDASIINCQINRNSVTDTGGEGGGVYSASSQVEIKNCLIDENESLLLGGGLYFTDWTDESAKVINCLLTDNIAGSKGGGIYSDWDSFVQIRNNTIVGNSAKNLFGEGYGGGLGCSYGGGVEIVDSIIWENTAANGSQIAVLNGDPQNPISSVVTVTYSDIQPLPDPNDVEEGPTGLDFVFCIDTTASMSGEIAAVKDSISEIVAEIAATNPDYRIAIVDFRDFPDDNHGASGLDYPYHDDLQFSSDLEEIQAGIDSVSLGNGRDWPESVYAGLMHCIAPAALDAVLKAGGHEDWVDPSSPGPDWRENANRVIILIGDSPPHSPEPYTGYTIDDIASAAKEESVQIFSILTGSGVENPETREYFVELANQTGGALIEAVEAAEVVDAIMKAINLIGTPEFTLPYVEAGCVLTGWDAQSQTWDQNTHNIEQDPLFVVISTTDTEQSANYYLSCIAAGQNANSPCIDAGFASADDLATAVGHSLTTRTDHVVDDGDVDMGYHYNAARPAKTYTLTLLVDRGSDDPLETRLKAVGGGLDAFEFYSPDSRMVKAGTQVSLEAILVDTNYTVKAWHNTDDDTSTAKTNSVRMTGNKIVTLECETTIPTLRTKVKKGNGTITPAGVTLWAKGTVVALKAIPTNASDIVRWLGTDDDALLGTTNTVTMTESKDVEVEFYTPTVYDVTGDFTEFQQAIYDADEGDIILLKPGTYEPVHNDAYVDGKNIIIQGYNPDDPATVAATIISGCQFHISGTNRKMIFNGITFQDARWRGGDGPDADDPYFDGWNGASIEGGAMRFSGNASATVKNCRFVECSVTGGNGGDGRMPSNADVGWGDGGWGGWAHGGAVYIGSGNPRFIHCEFTGNYVRGGSGGDAAQGPGRGGRGGSWDEELKQWQDWDHEPPGGYLPYWKYSGYGGAVYCDEGSTPEFRDCEFADNIAYGSHTGIRNTTYVEAWWNTPVTWFKIDRYGGAVYIAKGSETIFTRCTFKNNQTDTIGPEETVTHGTAPNPTSQEDSSLAYGGTIAFEDDAVVTLKDCVIENGLAHHGGGIYAEHATLTVADCNFVGNDASFGGAVYYVDTEAAISRTTFHENEATLDASQGGALAAFDSNSVFTDVVVVNNTSGRSGGGFFVAGSDLTTIKNGLFAKNTAGRDGGGLSVNWYSDITIDNCTFADNEVLGTGSGMSQGGGIYVGYQSYLDIIDSILWGNKSMTGQQIAVTTGFEFDPAPSTATISYMDVDNYPNSNAIYVAPQCTLNVGSVVFNSNPKFVKYPDSDASDIVSNYYLNQLTSPCKDKGSGSSIVQGLFDYTTSIDGIQDKYIVDLGYHYQTAMARSFCSYADMANLSDGRVNLADWAVFALWWLEGPCKEGAPISGGNNWCDGADLNFNSYIDSEDLTLFTSCWLEHDTEAPTPNPAEWASGGEPSVTETDSVYMEAMQARDKWSGVEYFFEATTPGGPGRNSGWRQSFDPARPGYIYSLTDPTVRAWIYEDTGLENGREYTYVVRVRDVAGNVTGDSKPVSVMPGVDSNPPTPNPAQWAVQPRQITNTSVEMVAVQATDPSGVEYRFVCEEDNNFSSGWRQNVAPGEVATYFATPWVYQINGLTLGNTYTFHTITRDRAAIPHMTAQSVSVGVTMVEIDGTPPQPNPPTLTVQKTLSGSQWYHILTAGVVTDPSGVEYQYRCVDVPGLIAFGVSVDWVNADNTLNGIYPFGLTFYPNSASKVPNIIWIPVSGSSNHTYQVRARDQAPNQNAGDWSLEKTTQ